MLPKRKLTELKARVHLEPTLDDVFVEGVSDKRLIDQAHEHQRRHRPVYSISSVCIPPEVLRGFGLTDGNRQRVLALCQYLEIPSESSVRCLIDADMDRHLDREMVFPGLSYTSYTDAEGVFLTSEILKDLVVNAGQTSIKNWTNFFPCIENIVKQIFCVRLVLTEMELNVKVPPISKSLSRSQQDLRFDFDTFVGKLSSEGLSPDCIQKVKDRCVYWHDRLAASEARAAGRGHDYFEVLAWVVKKFGGKVGLANHLHSIAVLFVPQVSEDLLAPLN